MNKLVIEEKICEIVRNFNVKVRVENVNAETLDKLQNAILEGKVKERTNKEGVLDIDMTEEGMFIVFVAKEIEYTTEENLKAVQLLIDHGIDVNWLNSRFETPLMMALNQIEIEVAELLIDNGGIVYQPPKRPKEQNTEEENKE